MSGRWEKEEIRVGGRGVKETGNVGEVKGMKKR